MLSTQADRLRDRADELRMLASGMDAPYIVPSTKETMALSMQSAASEMREAADTIESLRDRLQERECERVRDDVSGLNIPHNGWFVCSKCGEPLPIMNRYCGGCGAIVRKEEA